MKQNTVDLRLISHGLLPRPRLVAHVRRRGGSEWLWFKGLTMSRKLLWILCVLVLAALACNAPAGSPADATPPATQISATAQSTTQITPSAAATAVLPTPISGGTSGNGGSVGSDPVFIGPIQFTDNADALIGGFAFAEGIEEIWAVWQYANMREGLSIRRVWYLDGEVWIDRTVEWDFVKYGASGSVRDVSIYDRDNGLPAGEYKLELYIDGRLQDIAGNTGDGRAAFNIVGGGELAQSVFPAPSGGTAKIVIQGGGTMLEYTCDGCQAETISFHEEIIDVDWFPDENYVLYTTIDRTEQIGESTMGLKWQLKVLNLETRQTHAISEPDERFHDASISPDGQYIAVAAGTGYADAGNIDLSLAFLTVDASYQRTAARYHDDFITLPENIEFSVYPTEAGSYSLPGRWEQAALFVAPMALVGFESSPDFEPGLYEFDLATTTARRLGDLP